MKILRVNMSKLKITTEDFPAGQEFLGGRGLTAKILNDEVSPAVDQI